MKCVKTVYVTRKLARQFARKIGVRDSKKLRVYQCFSCGCFHLTSMSAEDVKILKDEKLRCRL